MKRKDTILKIRHFNRFYTEILGLLNQHILNSPYSLTEARILFEIRRIEDCSANILIDKLNIDRGYISRILKGFELKGLIEKEKSPTDRRTYYLYLTPKGEEVFSNLENKSNKQIEDLLGDFTEDEQKKILQSMEYIEDKLLDRLNPICIRSFKTKDIEWIIQKHRELYAREYGFDETFEGYVAEALYKFLEDYDKEKENIWIAEVNEEAVGMIAIVKVDNEVAQLRWFLIDPCARGKGLGHRLMDTVVSFCRDNNYLKIMLWTVSILDTARYLYESYGFKLTETNEHNIWGKHLIEERWDLYLNESEE